MMNGVDLFIYVRFLKEINNDIYNLLIYIFPAFYFHTKEKSYRHFDI